MRLLTLALAALALLSGGVALAPMVHASTPQLYLYEGNSCSVASQNATARNMLGHVEAGDVLFIDYSQTPDYAYANADYGLGCYKGQVANVALSVPLAFVKASAGGYGLTAGAYTLADVAAGKLDAFFVHVARSAVAHGFPNAHMRLGWEMNGNWYVWAAQGKTAAFQAAFCHVAAVMRAAAPSAKFTYWVNPSTNADASNEGPTCAAADVGMAWDQYESYWTQAGATSEPSAWTNAYGGWWGIDSMASWYGSLRHAVPEFGVGLETVANAKTTTDDPAFMAKLIAYDAARGAEFMGLWDTPAFTGYPGKITDGSHPGEALEVIKEWGVAPLPTLLAGAKLYTGTAYKAAPPAGYHAVLAQLASGDVEQLAWGDRAGQTIQASDFKAPARVAASPEPAVKVTKISPAGATTLVTPNADGSEVLSITFPKTAAQVDYIFWLSAARQLGFATAAGKLSGAGWQGGAEMLRFDWKSAGGRAQVYIAPN